MNTPLSNACVLFILQPQRPQPAAAALAPNLRKAPIDGKISLTRWSYSAILLHGIDHFHKKCHIKSSILVVFVCFWYFYLLRSPPATSVLLWLWSLAGLDSPARSAHVSPTSYLLLCTSTTYYCYVQKYIGLVHSSKVAGR